MAIDFIEKAISSFSLCQTTKTKTKTCHTFVLFFITVLASLFSKIFLMVHRLRSMQKEKEWRMGFEQLSSFL
jgi:hypothetical protein